MILYHGSTETVEQPRIFTGDKFLDFGAGFYTTSSKEQALRWATIKKNRTKRKTACLNIYEVEDSLFSSSSLSVLSFDNPSREWLEFIIANRRGFITHQYDIVRGAVANDTLYRVITIYESGVLTFEETINRLKVHELFDQLSFHTEKALEHLLFKECCLLD
jgi:hypothetical protein